MTKEAFDKLNVEAIVDVLGVGNSLESIIAIDDPFTRMLYAEIALKSYEQLQPKLEKIIKEINKDIDNLTTKH